MNRTSSREVFVQPYEKMPQSQIGIKMGLQLEDFLSLLHKRKLIPEHLSLEQVGLLMSEGIVTILELIRSWQAREVFFSHVDSSDGTMSFGQLRICLRSFPPTSLIAGRSGRTAGRSKVGRERAGGDSRRQHRVQTEVTNAHYALLIDSAAVGFHIGRKICLLAMPGKTTLLKTALAAMTLSITLSSLTPDRQLFSIL